MPRNHTRSKRAGSDQHSKKNDTGLAAPAQKSSKPRACEDDGLHAEERAALLEHLSNHHVTPNSTAHARRHLKLSSLLDDPEFLPISSLARDLDSERADTGPVVACVNDPAGREPTVTGGFASLSEPRSSTEAGRENHPRAASLESPLSGAHGFVLSASPARDTIALLIILFAVPSILLTPIQLLFAVLPFVSSVGTAQSWRQDPSFGPSGAPAVATILMADLILSIISLCISPSLRDLILDLAHAVVAVSLGRDSSDQQTPAATLSVCISTVAVLRILKLASPVTANAAQAMHYRDVISPSSPALLWVRRLARLTAVHLVAQTVLQWFRGCLLQQQKKQPISSDRTAKAEPHVCCSGLLGDGIDTRLSDQHVYAARLSCHHQSKCVATSPLLENEESILSSFSQPFWAAVANTRLQIIRAQHEALVSQSQDSRPGNSQSPSSAQSNGFMMYMTEVMSDAVAFLATQPVQLSAAQKDSEFTTAPSMPLPAFPALLRLNGNAWPSLRVRHEIISEDGTQPTHHTWHGWINDLQPDHVYAVEFSDASGHIPSYAFTVATPSGTSSNIPIESAIGLTMGPKTTNPRAPSDTVGAIEAASAEHKALLKRSKKEHKTLVSSIRKEIDFIRSKISSHDTVEDKNQRKILQANQQGRQHEDIIASLQLQLDSYAKAGHSKSKGWEDMRVKWEKQKAKLKALKQDLENAKDEVEQGVMDAEVERDSLQRIVDKTRVRKEGMANQKAAGTIPNTRSEKKRAGKVESRVIGSEMNTREEDVDVSSPDEHGRQELELSSALTSIQQHITETADQMARIYREISALDQSHKLDAAEGLGSSLTPEGDIPGTVPRKFSTDHGIAARYASHDGTSRWPFASPVSNMRSLDDGQMDG